MTDSDFRKHQRKAAKARWEKVAKAERSAQLSRVAKARWAKVKAQRKLDRNPDP